MLSASVKEFNQSDFDRRIRHYFSDSAPCVVSYKLGIDCVEVTNDDTGVSVTVPLRAELSEEENTRTVIEECENKLYPYLLETSIKTIEPSPEKVIDLVSSGLSAYEAMQKASRKICRKKYLVIRIGLNNNTLVIRDCVEKNKTVFVLKYMPVMKFLESLRNGKNTPETAYEYLVKNSEIKGASA